MGSISIEESARLDQGNWVVYDDIDLPNQGDMEIILEWQENTTMEAIMKRALECGYQAILVGAGEPLSFSYAILKNFPF